MKYIIILLLSLLYYSCSQKAKQPDVAISQIQYVDDRILKEQVLKGDTLAYIQLYGQYYQTDKGTDFLPWAIIMANKYHYKRAYQDAFNCILSINTYYGIRDSISLEKLNLLDTATLNLAKTLLYKTSDSVQINQSLKYIDLLPND